MANLDFSRAEVKDYEVSADRLFNGSVDFARDDSGSVDWAGKVVLMDIFLYKGGDPLVTLTSVDSASITIATDRLTFDYIFTELETGSYYYLLYNDTDKVGIQRGQIIAW